MCQMRKDLDSVFRKAKVRIHNIYQDSEYEGVMLITFSDIDNSPEILVDYLSTGEDISWMVGKELYVHLSMACWDLRWAEEEEQTAFLCDTDCLALYEVYGLLFQNDDGFYLEPCHALPFDIAYDMLVDEHRLQKSLGEYVCMRARLTAHLYYADEMIS